MLRSVLCRKLPLFCHWPLNVPRPSRSSAAQSTDNVVFDDSSVHHRSHWKAPLSLNRQSLIFARLSSREAGHWIIARPRRHALGPKILAAVLQARATAYIVPSRHQPSRRRFSRFSATLAPPPRSRRSWHCRVPRRGRKIRTIRQRM